ncbi:MAG: tRNA pseudouridine(38-40) synthase TruA [Eubacterium sp.]
MRNIQLIIAYKGTHYAGWQEQPDVRTVEKTLRKAIEAITEEPTILYGSGRTDAGVHAVAQSANFYTSSRIPAERFALALNTKLPQDIRVRASYEKPEDFHSRYCAKGKVYSYRLYLGPTSSPFTNDLSWHIARKIDLTAMEKAAKPFLGEHDFSGFMSAGSSVKNTVRTIYDIRFERKENLLTIIYEGSGFLYNMVRIITGTLYEVGVGEIDRVCIPMIIASCERNQAGITAPAKGLFLERVIY